MYTVYFLKSIRNQKYYVGFTEKEPDKRLKEHNSGTNQWTRQNGPFVLIYYEAYLCEKDAKRRELFYKSGFGKNIRDAIIRTVSAKGRPASGGG